ncbi:hypothetical protein WN51_08564 [Melipona quadrifasciata]|uniref:Uncharacterized protein n=1 Tax=Melipona quadrifasciata TaxID=166423 RepID=A0A0M9A7H0_9HYME|nr:hypothetical protein WN51_08564 [Melipona quadrifasciata]
MARVERVKESRFGSSKISRRKLTRHTITKSQQCTVDFRTTRELGAQTSPI